MKKTKLVRSTSEGRVFTVSMLTDYIKDKLKSDKNLNNIGVRGEISNLTKHGSGNVYFTIKDEESQMSCVLFKSYISRLKFELEHGQKVLVVGSISVYKPQGKYQLIVTEVRHDGLGDLHQKFLDLKKKLEEEGLFKEEFKKKIPRFPNTIGVVSSPTGAAINDVISRLTDRWPCINIRLAPAVVQGVEGAKSISDAIKLLDSMGDVDLIIICRGGGSLEDLWCFNEEEVARTIFNAKKPIISGVGHHTDFTIADFVADLRAETPSAAAEKAVPDKSEVLNILGNYQDSFRLKLDNQLNKEKQKLIPFEQDDIFRRLTDFVTQESLKIDSTTTTIQSGMNVHLEKYKNQLGLVVKQITCSNPKTILKKGYSITMKQGKIVKSVKQAKVNDQVTTILNDGQFESKIREVKKR